MASVLGVLKYPFGTMRAFVDSPRLAWRNTRIVCFAFARTIGVGFRAINVLKYRTPGTAVPFFHGRKKWEVREEDGSVTYIRRTWSTKTRSRYIWRVARLFWAQPILRRAEVDVRVHIEGWIGWKGPYVFVVNHQSTLDILILVAIILFARFVAKKEVLVYPVVGGAARFGAQIIVDRKNHGQSIEALARGFEGRCDVSTVFFVEGTRTQDGKLGKFKKGAFHVAKKTGMPIIPIAISGAFDALPKGSLLRLKRKSTVYVQIGEPIEVLPGDSPESLRVRTKIRMEKMLARLS